MEYNRTPGGATFHGLRYECNMVALLYLRCLKREDNEFRLASNVCGLGKFDDIVLRWSSEGKCRCILIQMKHRENEGLITLDQLVPSAEAAKKSKDFNLIQYFNSYCKIKNIFENSRNASNSHILKGIDFINCEFVLLTNSFVKHNSPNATELSDWEILINTKEEKVAKVFSFGPEDSEIWNLRKGYDNCEEYQNFLRKLRIFCGQSDVNQLSALVRAEVETCAHVQGKAAQRLHSSFTSNIESWWNNDDEFLQNLLEFRREKRIDQLCDLVSDGVLSFGQTDKLRVLCTCLYREVLSWGNQDNKFLDRLKDRRRDLSTLCKLMRDVEAEDPQRFYSSFSDAIVNWWKKAKKKEKKSQFLTKTSSPWFRAIMDHLNIGVTEKLKSVHCAFQPDLLLNLNELIVTEENLNIFSPGINCVLMCSKMHTKIVKDFRGKYLLMDETDVYQEKDNVLAACQSGHCRVLVIAMQNDAQLLKHAKEFRSERCKVVYLSEQKILPELITCSHIEDEWKFNQLSSDTQQRVLQSTVHFQGAEVQLKDMCGSDVQQLLTGKALSTLLLGEELILGRPLPTLSELYIPRTLCHRAVLNKHILTMSDENDIFAVSNTKHNIQLGKQVLLNRESPQNSLLHLSYEGEMVSTSKYHPDKTLFEELCQKYRGQKNVHWVEMQNEFFVWRQSCGADSTPRRFIERMSKTCKNGPLCSHTDENLDDWNNKLMLVTGQPGMGKTSLLHYVAQTIKQKDPLSWVVYWDLGKSIDILRNIKADDISWSQVLDILTTISIGAHSKCSELEEELLKKRLEKDGNITVLLDSVDEVSPVYMKHVVHIVRLLLDSKLSRLWVASRTVVEEHLKQELTALPLLLQPLTGSQQHGLLSQYIDKQIREGNNSLEGKVQFLLEQTSNVGLSGRHICDIPLHAIMITDAVIQNLKQNSDLNLITDGIRRLTLYKIYKTFIETKREHFEKSLENIEMLKANGILNREKENFMKIHMKCAIVAVFSPEEISTFRFPNEQEKVTQFLEDLVEEKTGIIDGRVNNTPSFIHHTFAEYFVALWLVQNLVKNNNGNGCNVNYEVLCDAKYDFLSRIFEEMMTEGFNMHAAVLMGNKELVKQMMESGAPVDSTDKGGRLAIHLAAAQGETELLRLLLSAGSPVSTADGVLGWSPLRYADRSERWEAAEELLQAGANSEDLHHPKKYTETQSKMNFLVSNVSNGYFEITKNLLQMGYSTEGRNTRGISPLYAAAMGGHIRLVRELFANGADANYANSDGRTPIFANAERSHPEVLRELIAHSADVNLKNNDGDNSLHIASLYGHTEKAHQLISSGADINITDHNGCTALHLAVWKGHIKLAHLLISSGADVNSTSAEGWTPLFYVRGSGQSEMAQLLISNGTDVNSTDNSGCSLLHRAALSGDTKLAELLISTGADINRTDNYGQTPLHYTAMLGHSDTAHLLITSGADVNSTDSELCTPIHSALKCDNSETAMVLMLNGGADFSIANVKGWNPLHLAAWDGKTETALQLIASGADVNSIDNGGWTPMHRAAWNGHKDTAQQLISRGADVNSTDNLGWTPVHRAAWSGHTETAQLLIASGADINSMDNEGRTPVHRAAWNGHTETAQQLIANGADVNGTDNKGCTTVHKAASNGHTETIQLLISRGADVNSTDNEGWTPLHRAALNGHTETAQLLIASGAYVNSTDNGGRTPLHRAALNGHTETAQLLIASGAYVNSTDNKGWTPLHDAALNKLTETAQLLIASGADVSSTDNYGRTPLFSATRYGHTETAQQLISSGADVNSADIYGCTSLHSAARKGHTEIAHTLISSGADVNSTDNYGRTPLFSAALNGHTETARQLMSSGADINKTDNEGRTPLHIAAKNGHYKTAKLLISSGADVNSTDNEKRTPLLCATIEGHTEIAQQLITSGAVLTEPVIRGCTPLHSAAWDGHSESTQQLISSDAEVNCTENDECIPLCIAAWNGHTETHRN